MTGFRNFLLRGNLIDLAVAVIIGLAFNDVVKTFVAWLTDLLPNSSGWFDPGDPFGAFLNAVLSFVILAAVVYFFIVTPYTTLKERYFPSPPPGPSTEALLTEIRDLLAVEKK
jgi:large conductance mechanosensitive channel